jgi:hypothetical protein
MNKYRNHEQPRKWPQITQDEREWQSGSPYGYEGKNAEKDQHWWTQCDQQANHEPHEAGQLCSRIQSMNPRVARIIFPKCYIGIKCQISRIPLAQILTISYNDLDSLQCRNEPVNIQHSRRKYNEKLDCSTLGIRPKNKLSAFSLASYTIFQYRYTLDSA